MSNPQDESSQELNEFWNQVRSELKDQPQVYTDILSDFWNWYRERTDQDTCIQQLVNVFRGNRVVSDSFHRLFVANAIDPNQAEISGSSLGSTGTSLMPSSQQATAEYETLTTEEGKKALAFLNLIKYEFRNKPEVMMDYYNVCMEYRRKMEDERKVMLRLSNLIRGHREIIVNFNRLFPQYRIDLDQKEPVSMSGSSLEATGTSHQLPTQQATVSISNNNDLNQQEPVSMSGASLGATGTSLPVSTQQATAKTPLSRWEVAKKEGLCFIDHVKNEYINRPEVYNSFVILTRQLIQENDETLGIIRQIATMFNGHPVLNARFNDFLSPKYRIEMDERMHVVDVVSLQGSSLQTSHRTNPPTASSPEDMDVCAAQSYIDQVRHQLRNRPEDFNAFLDLTKQLSTENKETPQLIQQISNLLRGHPDLIAGYNQFFDPMYKIKVEHDEEMEVDEGPLMCQLIRLANTSKTQQSTLDRSTAATTSVAQSSSAESSGAQSSAESSRAKSSAESSRAQSSAESSRAQSSPSQSSSVFMTCDECTMRLSIISKSFKTYGRLRL